MIGQTQTTYPKAPATIADLHKLSVTSGISIGRHTGGVKGYYTHEKRLISLRADLSQVQYRCTLAHELGHAILGDVPTGNDFFDQRQETRAWKFAATLLIFPTEFHAAHHWHGGHLPSIAEELGITRYLLEFWLNQLERTPTL